MKYVCPSKGRTQRGNLRYLEELRMLARKNRNNPTKAELLIWNMILRKHRIKYHFLRQKPIGRFIADFFSSKLMLVIEIDGDSHDNKKYYDLGRDELLKTRGILTVRYTNDQVLKTFFKVTKDLEKIIKQRSQELSLFSKGDTRR